MFLNSLNGGTGVIYKIEPTIYGIKYYDSMYRKTIYVWYETKEKRDKDFDNISDYNNYYSKVN